MSPLIDSHPCVRRSSEHSLQNKVARLLWHVIYVLLFRFSPRVCHAWRCGLLRLFGAQVGRGVLVYPTVKIWAPWNLQLGDGACIGDHVECYNVGQIAVGRHATVSQSSCLCTATHDYRYLHYPLVIGKIEIRDYAWVCAQAFVLPNVVVQAGTVVGARSVVTQSLPPWVIAAGHPCQPIKPREILQADSPAAA